MNILSATALFVGGLLTVQAAANLQLTRAVGTPYGAATLQLWVAAGLLGLLAALVGGLPALTRVADVPWWFLLGGLASPLYITSGILLFSRVGALAAGGLFVTGQVLASAALDTFGLLGVPRHPLDAVVTGSLAVLAGITVIVKGGQRAVFAGRAPSAPRCGRRRAGLAGAGCRRRRRPARAGCAQCTPHGSAPAGRRRAR